jgi:outer membrane protein assembly factor BamE (lipoprotein component of BamABCDE complex)
LSHRPLVLARIGALLAAAGLAAALSACAPIRTTSGYQAIEHQPKDMKVGVDTKSTVLDLLGSPSAQSTFDTNTWYYISQNTATVGYHTPHITKRAVTAITFDKESEKVAKIDTYSLKDGKVLAYNIRETPTRGRELSALEQLLGTVGRGALLPDQDPGPGQRPGAPGQP